MNDIIRIGVVGAGSNTKEKHIPALQSMERVEIVSVCNRSWESSKKVAAQFNIPQIYKTWLELVNSPDTDAIIIGTWPYLHHTITLAALAVDKHVMCEARMARNASEAREMQQAAAQKPHLVTQVVPAPFTFGVDATVKRLIAEGFLGKVLAVEITEKRGFLDPKSPLSWRQSYEYSGQNIMGLGIWYETVMRWIGPAKRVVGMGKTFVKMRLDQEANEMKAVQIPEHLDVIADMECGAQMHIGLSQVTGFRNEFEITLYGSQGTLQYIDHKLYGGQKGEEKLSQIRVPANEVGEWRVEEEFINGIRGIEPIRNTTFEKGVEYMEFTEAVTRSIKEGRVIPLPLSG